MGGCRDRKTGASYQVGAESGDNCGFLGQKKSRGDSLGWRSWSVTRWGTIFQTLKSIRKTASVLLNVRTD